MKHILIASLGLFPQVISEALWAFMHPGRLIDPAHRARSPIVPREIVLIATTSFKQPQYSSTEDRDRQIRDRIGTLFKQYGHPAPKIDIQKLKDETKQGADAWLKDIRTQRENTVYSNHVVRLVKAYSEQQGTAVHMLLAGGRKTMSSYDQSAMMFFGRAQDTLSHVLVEPIALEATWDFWWPDQPFSAKTANSVEVATGSDIAQIDLVDVPFARLGVRLPAGISDEALDARLITEFVEFEVKHEPIVVNAESTSIEVGNQIIKLRTQEFCLFALFAVARAQRWVGAGPKDEGIGGNAGGWIQLHDMRFGKNADGTARNSRALLFLELLHHRLKGFGDDDLIAKIRNNKTSSTYDPTSYGRSRLDGEISESPISPFIKKLILPAAYGDRYPQSKVLGILINPDRIALRGFSEAELEVGDA